MPRWYRCGPVPRFALAGDEVQDRRRQGRQQRRVPAGRSPPAARADAARPAGAWRHPAPGWRSRTRPAGGRSQSAPASSRTTLASSSSRSTTLTVRVTERAGIGPPPSRSTAARCGGSCSSVLLPRQTCGMTTSGSAACDGSTGREPPWSHSSKPRDSRIRSIDRQPLTAPAGPARPGGARPTARRARSRWGPGSGCGRRCGPVGRAGPSSRRARTGAPAGRLPGAARWPARRRSAGWRPARRRRPARPGAGDRQAGEGASGGDYRPISRR